MNHELPNTPERQEESPELDLGLDRMPTELVVALVATTGVAVEAPLEADTLTSQDADTPETNVRVDIGSVVAGLELGLRRLASHDLPKAADLFGKLAGRHDEWSRNLSVYAGAGLLEQGLDAATHQRVLEICNALANDKSLLVLDAYDDILAELVEGDGVPADAGRGADNQPTGHQTTNTTESTHYPPGPECGI